MPPIRLDIGFLPDETFIGQNPTVPLHTALTPTGMYEEVWESQLADYPQELLLVEPTSRSLVYRALKRNANTVRGTLIRLIMEELTHARRKFGEGSRKKFLDRVAEEEKKPQGKEEFIVTHALQRFPSFYELSATQGFSLLLRDHRAKVITTIAQLMHAGEPTMLAFRKGLLQVFQESTFKALTPNDGLGPKTARNTPRASTKRHRRAKVSPE